MVTRRERQKRDRERRILGAASGLFGTRGYADTGMEQIATAADLAVGTLYNYFPSKAQLLLAIVRQETRDLLAAGRRVLDDPPSDPIEAVAALFDVYAAGLAHHDRRLWRELLCAAIGEPRTIGARVFESDLRLIAQLGSLLEGLRAQRLLSSQVDPSRVAIVLYGVYFAWFNAFLIAEQMTLETLRAELRQGVRIVLRGALAPDGIGRLPQQDAASGAETRHRNIKEEKR